MQLQHILIFAGLLAMASAVPIASPEPYAIRIGDKKRESFAEPEEKRETSPEPYLIRIGDKKRSTVEAREPYAIRIGDKCMCLEMLKMSQRGQRER